MQAGKKNPDSTTIARTYRSLGVATPQAVDELLSEPNQHLYIINHVPPGRVKLHKLGLLSQLLQLSPSVMLFNEVYMVKYIKLIAEVDKNHQIPKNI